MEMEPRSTAEGEEPRTDDVNVTLTSDPHNDQAQGTEQAHGGHYHPIEATYPSSLHSMKNYERKELEKSTSDGDHNCLDHSGDALEQDDCSSPSVKRAAHMGSINKSDEPSLNTALVPYDRFRVERDEDASKEGLTHFPRFDKEPETYEGSAKLLGKRSLGASFDDVSESESPDDSSGRQSAPYEGAKHHPTTGIHRRVRWTDVDTQDHDTFYSSDGEGFSQNQSGQQFYQDQTIQEFPEPRRLNREEAESRQARRGSEDSRSHQNLEERQRGRMPYDDNYSSDSDLSSPIPLSSRSRSESSASKRSLSGSRSRNWSQTRSSFHQEDKDVTEDARSPPASKRSLSGNRDRSRSPRWFRERFKSQSDSPRRSHVAPISAERDNNAEELASKGNEVIEDARKSSGFPGAMLRAWHKKYVNFGEGVETELLVINAAESFADEKDKSVVTLYCQKNPLDRAAPAPRQIHWLHVRHTSDILKVIKSLIICCPIIRTEYYKSLALGLLERVTPKNQDLNRSSNLTSHRTRTNVLRTDGANGNTVTYYSTPYFVFREGRSREMGHETMESLLSAHYGYDVGDARDKMQILSETQKWLGKDILQVARMKCLLIGADVLLTWAEVPLSTVCKDNIIIDESDLRPLVTVKITDFLDKEHCSYIKNDMSFAELIAYITNLTSFKDFDVFEDRYGGFNVTSETWATILEEARATLDEIRLYLRRKGSENHAQYGRHSGYYTPPPPWFDRPPVTEIHSNSRSASTTQLPSFSHPQPVPASEGYTPRTALILRPRASSPYAGSGSGTNRHLNRDPPTQSVSANVPLSQRNPGAHLAESESFSSSKSGSISSSSMRMTVYARDREAKPSYPHEETCQSLQLWSRSRVDGINENYDLPKTTAQSRAAHSIKSIEGCEPTRRRESRTYHLSSSEDGSDREAPSTKPPSIASRRSFVRTRSRERPRNREQVTSFITPVTPFLMWKVTQRSAGGQKEEGSISTMVRLLRKTDGSLQGNALYGRLYKSGYECSLEDICSRHAILSRLNPKSATIEATKRSKFSDGELPSQESTHNPSSFSPSSTNDPPLARHGPCANTVQQANELIREIFTISKTILALYLPLEDEGAGFYAHIRNIINRFWGALDLIFRHIRYAALMNAAEGVQSWTIKGSCYGHAETPAAEICKACDGNTEYDLVGALEHLHAGRGQTQPPGHKIPPAPHEDPCVVWLQNVKEVETDPLFNTLMRDLSIFKQDLEKILDESEKLHLFVARPGFRPDRNLHDEVQDNRPSQGQERSGNQLEALALPTSLLRAFQNIVALLCVQARMVLMTCREDDIEIHRNSRANKGRTRYSRILETVMTSLGNAREDLILAITAGNTSSVRFSAVGAEYIVTTAMTNLQTGALRISAGSSKVPLNLSGLAGEVRRGTRRIVTGGEDLGLLEAALQKPGQNAPTTATTELDLMAFYEAHARALDFNASIRPQRRAFLAIRALEEELRAIKDLNVTQWRCLDTTGLVLHPMSFPVVDQDRVARFALELKVIERAKAERKREHEDMLRMLHRAADLRARVKESIEVLDEGHGNAIRVFTLVTLFFLPLSFVTSFFGMNTVDIRDMPQSSWTYWATAAPITLLVLCSAYLYAYKWEAIRRRVTRKTWLDADVSHSMEPSASQPIESRGSFIPRRLDDLRRRRRSNLGLYSDRGRGDTLGLTGGETMADIS